MESDKYVWQLENYLADRRRIVDEKYDYRYSRVIIVFSRLFSEGFLMKRCAYPKPHLY
ncbi:MAG: hypothetical protein GY936_10855 [Ignavibacteriae bacterium]|nr:hypothetical protein [Ignavibacteriota bacterium]